MSTYADSAAIAGMSIVLSVLGIVTVTGRFYIRKVYKHGIGLDDWFMLPSLLAAVTMGVTIIIGTENKSHGHPMGVTGIDELTPEPILVQKLFFVAVIVNTIGLMFAKLSIIYFYRRIFATGSNKFFDYITRVLIFLIVSWGIAFFFLFLFGCGTNILVRWGRLADQMGYCINSQVVDLCLVITDLFMDLVLFILPIPLIMGLQMSIARRLAVILAFSIGALTLVASAIRVVLLGYIHSGVSNHIYDQDPILNESIFLYWSMLESGLTVIVACLPTFQVWIRKINIKTITTKIYGFASLRSFSSVFRTSSTPEYGAQTSQEVCSSNTYLHQTSLEIQESKNNLTVTSYIDEAHRMEY